MSKSTRAIGDAAEDLACSYLAEKGWEILDRNYYYGKAEIDIIAQKDSLIAFIEVKMRKNAHFGRPVEFVDEGKIDRVFRAAEHWAHENHATHFMLRFDVIGILHHKNSAPEITHYEDAYR